MKNEKGKFVINIFDQFSIKFRLILSLVILTALALLSMMYFSTSSFQEDKLSGLKVNHYDLAKLIATRTEDQLSFYLERMKIVTSFIQKKEFSTAEKLINESNQIVSILNLIDDSFVSVSSKSLLAKNQINMKQLLDIAEHWKQELNNSNANQIDVKNAVQFIQTPIFGILFKNKDNLPIIAFVELATLLNFCQIGGGAEVQIINSAGQLVVHSDIQKLAENINLGEKQFVKEIMSSNVNNGQRQFEENKQPFLGSFIKIDNLGLTVIVSIATNIVFSPIHQMTIRNLYFLIIVLGITTLAAFFLAKSISNPIKLMTEKTKQYRIKQDTKQKIEYETKLLSLAFDNMVHNIEESRVSLEHYAQKLENQVSILEEAKHDIERASKAKSLFMANMSHELRTPINAIVGFSEMLIEDAIEEKNAKSIEYLEDIKTSANRLLEFVSNILDMSKIEADQVELNLTEFDLYIFLRQLIASLKPLVTKNNNVMQFNCDSNFGVIQTDEGKLRQTLVNVMGNACKFTKDGIISLDVTKSKDTVTFEIKDNGPGIPSSKLETIFDVFSQVDQSESRKFEGSGLGLAITRRYCELLGGNIMVESKVNKGSIFTISLPLRSSSTKKKKLKSPPKKSSRKKAKVSA